MRIILHSFCISLKEKHLSKTEEKAPSYFYDSESQKEEEEEEVTIFGCFLFRFLLLPMLSMRKVSQKSELPLHHLL